MERSSGPDPPYGLAGTLPAPRCQLLPDRTHRRGPNLPTGGVSFSAEGQADRRRQPSRKRPSDEPWGFDSPSFRLLRCAFLALRRCPCRVGVYRSSPRQPQVTLLLRLLLSDVKLDTSVF